MTDAPTPPEGELPPGHPARFNPFFNMLETPLYRTWVYRIKFKGNARDEKHEAALNEFIQEQVVEQGYLLNRIIPHTVDSSQLVLLIFGDYNPGVALHIQSQRRLQSDRDMIAGRRDTLDQVSRLGGLPPEPDEDDAAYPELIPTLPPTTDPRPGEGESGPTIDEAHED